MEAALPGRHLGSNDLQIVGDGGFEDVVVGVVPAVLGASAAWLGGFARGSHPQVGAARGFGVVGIVLAVLQIIATVFGGAAGQLFR